MSSAVATNGSVSAATYGSEKRPVFDESQFLQGEADNAKEAVVRSLKELEGRIRDQADIRKWARNHPWGALGAAVAVGFTAGAVALRKRPVVSQARRELAAELRALRAEV